MTADVEDAPALVVLVNNLADWRRVVEEGWYRIPLNRAPHPAAASFLAFYHTRVFGADAFRVRYYAPVERYHIVTRRELLPDEPDHPRAHHRYYRVTLGPLRELQYPVPSRRLRRVTFIPTTLRRLLEADEINDLWIDDDMEAVLWQLFRDAGIKAERRLEIGEGTTRYIAPLAIPVGSSPTGGIAVFCDERERPSRLGRWELLQLSPTLIYAAPRRCLEQVRTALLRYSKGYAIR